jgi:hypothetical protein
MLKLSLALDGNSGGSSNSSNYLLGTQVVYLGRENNNAASDYAVSNWSAASVPKKFVSNNRYGRSGYYQLRPGNTTITEAVGNSNNLGTAAAIQPTLFSKPSFANVSGSAGTFVNFGGYPNFLGTDGVTVYRQGALSISVNQGPFTSPTGENASYVGSAFTITMTENAIFLLGVAVDTVADVQYTPRYVSVFSSSTGTVFSEPIPLVNSIPRLPVFAIQGNSGNVFTIGMWQDTGANSVAPFSLITFDRIPFPT